MRSITLRICLVWRFDTHIWRACVRAGYFEPDLAVQSLLKSADGAGLHRADIAKEAQVTVAALQAYAQGEGCFGMNTTYTVKHIQKGPTLFITKED